jgi:integrase
VIYWLGGCSSGGVSTLPNSNPPEVAKESTEKTLGEAIKLLKISKIASNRRPIYIAELDRVLRQITRGMEDKPLSYLDASKIETFLAEHHFCPMAQASFIGRVSTLFEFAKRRKWILVNPCEEIEKPIVEWKTPYVLSPAQVEKLFRFAQLGWPERVLYLSLCGFCGLRPTEARQVLPTDINTNNGTIRIEASTSKIRQRRICHMHATALEWIKHALPAAQTPVSEGTRKRWTKDFARALGFEGGFKQDCLRHTCASFLLADKQDAPWVAMQLGNSPGILFRHYIDLSSDEDTKAFWGIKP